MKQKINISQRINETKDKDFVKTMKMLSLGGWGHMSQEKNISINNQYKE